MSAELLFGESGERAVFEEQVLAREGAEETTEDAITPLLITSPLLGAALGFTYTVSTAVHC